MLGSVSPLSWFVCISHVRPGWALYATFEHPAFHALLHSGLQRRQEKVKSKPRVAASLKIWRLVELDSNDEDLMSWTVKYTTIAIEPNSEEFGIVIGKKTTISYTQDFQEVQLM